MPQLKQEQLDLAADHAADRATNCPLMAPLQQKQVQLWPLEQKLTWHAL